MFQPEVWGEKTLNTAQIRNLKKKQSSQGILQDKVGKPKTCTLSPSGALTLEQQHPRPPNKDYGHWYHFSST